MTQNRNRQPQGLSIGGQFAAENKPEAGGVSLSHPARRVLEINGTEGVIHSDPDLGEVYVTDRGDGFDLVSERFDSYEAYVPGGITNIHDYLADREDIVDAMLAERYPNMEITEVTDGEYHLGFRSTVDAADITTEEVVASLRKDSGHVQYNADFINHASPGATALTARLTAYDQARAAGLDHDLAVEDSHVRGSLAEAGHRGGVIFAHGDHDELASLSAGMRPGHHYLLTGPDHGSYAVGPDGGGGWLAADDDGDRTVSGETVHGWGDTPAEAVDTAMLNKVIDWEIGEGTYGDIGFRGAKIESVKGSDIPAKHGTDYVVDMSVEFVTSETGEDDFEMCTASAHPVTGEVLFMSDGESGVDRSEEISDDIRRAAAAKMEDVRGTLNRAPELSSRARAIMGLPEAKTLYVRDGADRHQPVRVEVPDEGQVVVDRADGGVRTFIPAYTPPAQVDPHLTGSVIDEDGDTWLLERGVWHRVISD